MSKFSKIGNLFFFRWSVRNYILLSVTDNFCEGKWAKIERNDGKLLRWSIEECTRVNSESVQQYAKIVWASLISSLEVARYDSLPHRVSQTFQPPQFSVKIKKKRNFYSCLNLWFFSNLFSFGYCFMIVLWLEIHGVFFEMFLLFYSVTSAVTAYNVGVFKKTWDTSNTRISFLRHRNQFQTSIKFIL